MRRGSNIDEGVPAISEPSGSAKALGVNFVGTGNQRKADGTHKTDTQKASFFD